MRLQACPLCTLVENVSTEEAGDDDMCVKITYAGQKAVTLRHHSPTVAPEVVQRAFGLLGEFSGTVRDIEVAGHWGLVVVPGDWSETESRSIARSE